MLLSDDSIAALHLLSKVSPRCLVRDDGVGFAVDEQRSFSGRTTLPDKIPRHVAFADIRAFLNGIVLLGPRQTDVSFESGRCHLVTSKESVFVALADTSTRRTLLRQCAAFADARPRTLFGFTFGHEKLLQVQRIASRFKKSDRAEMRVTADGTMASLTLKRGAPRKKDEKVGLDSFKLSLAECARQFAFVVRAGAIMSLPTDDYDAMLVTVSGNRELRLLARTRRITYACPLTVSTVEIHHAHAPHEA